MQRKLRYLSVIFTSIPAVLFGVYTITAFREEYFWALYVVTSSAYLAVSFVLGGILPVWWVRIGIRKAWVWLLMQGILAWFAAILVLGMVSLTRLCVGQDNGDGINDLFMCLFQTGAVSFFYSPIVFVILGLSTILGNWAMKGMIEADKSAAQTPSSFAG